MIPINRLSYTLIITFMPCWFLACQNDVKDIEDINKYYLSEGGVVAPDAIIWSGGQIFTNSFRDNKFSGRSFSSYEGESRGANDNARKKEVEAHLYLQSNNVMSGSRKFEISDITSILSLYLRYPHDVEIIMPVPEEAYLDLTSFQSEEMETNNSYKGEKVSYSNLIGENAVSLHIEYVSSSQDELTHPVKLEGYGEFSGGYIRIYTLGINEDVLNYCKNYYDDGINFKIYNYFHRGNKDIANNVTIDKTGLKTNFLDRSLISFDWQNTDIPNKDYPDQFVNAISCDELYNPLDSDCNLWILGDRNVMENDNGLYSRSNQRLKNGTIVLWNDSDSESKDIERNHFNDPYQGNHFNNSPYNLIYEHKVWESASITD